MGVTTSSDATVIVVSEETGIISLAINGHLIRNIPEDQLRRYLTAGLIEAGPVVSEIREKDQSISDDKKQK